MELLLLSQMLKVFMIALRKIQTQQRPQQQEDSSRRLMHKHSSINLLFSRQQLITMYLLIIKTVTVIKAPVSLKLMHLLQMISSRPLLTPLAGKQLHVILLQILQLMKLKILIKPILLHQFMPQMDAKQ